MNAFEFVAVLREHGVTLLPGPGGRLTVRGPKQVLTRDVKAAIDRHEHRILAALEREYQGTPGPCIRCGRAARIPGAERLHDWNLICGDCATPDDVAEGCVPAEVTVRRWAEA